MVDDQSVDRIYLYDCLEYVNTMTDSDGRSTFAVLYLGLALVSMLLFFVSMETATGYAGAGVITLFLLFTVIFGIVGMYKLLTLSKGKSNNDGENNIEGEKSRNSNLEIRLFRDPNLLLRMFVIIFVTVLFIWMLFFMWANFFRHIFSTF